MYIYRYFILFGMLLITFLPASAFAQSEFPLWGKLEAGRYQVGYRTVFARDQSRTYDVDFGASLKRANNTGRPVQISIWYPATVDSKAKRMSFSDYVYLLASEETFGPVTGEQKLIAKQKLIMHLKWWTSQTASMERVDQLMTVSTGAYKDAAPMQGTEKFPLILLAQGAHQSSFYHSILAEYLASHGFVVATSPSMGMTSRLMPATLKGGETQARDVEYILAFMNDQPYVDQSRIAVTAFSFGGVAASLVQMRNARVRAVLSLDSVMGFGRFTPIIKQSAYFDLTRANVPYMHMMPQEGNGFDLTYLESLKYAPMSVLKFKGLAHFDFSSLGVFENRIFPVPSDHATTIQNGYEIVCKYALNFFKGFLKDDREALAFIKRSPEENGIPAGLVVASTRMSSDAVPTSEQFGNLILTQGVETALRQLNEIRKADPANSLLEEQALNNLGYQLIFLGRVKDAIDIFKLNVELYPKSFNVYDSLAEGYMINGDKDLAIKNYELSLSLNPGNTNAVDKLKLIR